MNNIVKLILPMINLDILRFENSLDSDQLAGFCTASKMIRFPTVFCSACKGMLIIGIIKWDKNERM